MAYDYYNYVARLGELSGLSWSDVNLPAFIPMVIDYAEQRMYRELDLQVTRVTDTSGALTANARNFSLPTSVGTFVVVEQVNLVTPSTATSTSGTLVPLVPITKEFIDYSWPSNSSNTGQPIFFAPISNTSYVVGPSPDSSYPIVVVGTQRPTALSSANTTTFLTTNLPDLFMAASMVYASDHAPASQANQSQTWEAQYQSLFQSANVEELRKRFMAEGWQAMTPSPVATPKRV